MDYTHMINSLTFGELGDIAVINTQFPGEANLDPLNGHRHICEREEVDLRFVEEGEVKTNKVEKPQQVRANYFIKAVPT